MTMKSFLLLLILLHSSTACERDLEPKRTPWKSQRLTWSLFNETVAEDRVRAGIAQWTDGTDFVFVQVSPQNRSADVKILLHDKTYFHNRQTVGGWVSHGNEIHINLDANNFDMQYIVAHEMGHVLGLGHDTFQFSVMNSTFRFNNVSIRDKNRLYRLYHRAPISACLPSDSDYVTQSEGKLYAFSNDEYKILDLKTLRVSEGYTTDTWAFPPADKPQVITAFFRSLQGEDVFVSGKRYWKFNSNEKNNNYRELISEDYHFDQKLDVPCNVKGAFTVNGKHTYLLTATHIIKDTGKTGLIDNVFYPAPFKPSYGAYTALDTVALISDHQVWTYEMGRPMKLKWRQYLYKLYPSIFCSYGDKKDENPPFPVLIDDYINYTTLPQT